MSGNSPISGPDFVFQVDFNEKEFSLDYQFENITIPSGTNVLWKINNLPEHWSTIMEFYEKGVGVHNFRGPFEEILVTDQGLLGINSQPSSEPWTFRILVQKGLASFGIGQAVAMIGASQELTVRGEGKTIDINVLLKQEGGVEVLTVDREHVRIDPGERILWDFTEVVEKFPNYQPFISYGSKPITQGQRSVPNFSFGPFVGFKHSEGRVLAYGNTGIEGVYRYDVFALDLDSSTVRLFSSGDPQTDNEGDNESTT